MKTYVKSSLLSFLVGAIVIVFNYITNYGDIRWGFGLLILGLGIILGGRVAEDEINNKMELEN